MLAVLVAINERVDVVVEDAVDLGWDRFGFLLDGANGLAVRVG